MGLTRTEQWTLIGVVIVILGGFIVQYYQARRTGAVVWVEAGERWNTNPVSEAGSPPATLENSDPEEDKSPPRSSAPETSPSPGALEPVSGEAPSARLALNLNTANQGELELLPGIGPVRAKAILAYRLEHGSFTTVEELLAIKGIGPKTLDRLRPLVRAGQGQPFGQTSTSSTGGTGSTLQKLDTIEDTTILIDVNRASSEELQTLDGIGPVLAERIIESRLKAPFRSVDELERVRGIGPKTLQRLRGSVVVR